MSLSDERERRAIATETGSNVFVEASAGTGKTSCLVNRIVHLVEQDRIPLGQIAAITFTEAAARELRNRVRSALLARAAETDNEGLVSAVAQLENADFTTLHGFALSILRKYSIEAGLPLDFTVTDEVAHLIDFDARWLRFLNAVGDDMDLLKLQTIASALGVRIDEFAQLAMKMDNNWDLLQRFDPDSLPLLSVDHEYLLVEAEQLVGLVDQCTDPNDKLVLALLSLEQQVEKARAAPQDLTILKELKVPKRNLGKKESWSVIPVEEVRDRCASLGGRIEDYYKKHTDRVISICSGLVTNFVLDWVQERNAKGEVSYHDLLVLVRDLLRNNENVRQGLHQRYLRLLLDEFQDTDPIQIELAALLCSASSVGQRPWPELLAELEPGRLAVVGDPKQSIYRFRRADIGTYRQAEEAMESMTVRLESNFRSLAGITDWINAFFEPLMNESNEADQSRYLPLISEREGLADSPAAVTVIGGPVKEKVNLIRKMEAEDIAAMVCRINADSWPVWDQDAWRPARLSDIAVLIPSRLTLPVLETVFDTAGIPLRAETSSLVYSTPEIRELLSAVKAVVDPLSELDVVAMLRSSLFGIGDDELLAWKRSGRSWDYRQVVTDDSTMVANALLAVKAWHDERFWLSPSELVSMIIEQRRLRELALSAKRPRDRWRRYRFLIEQAREFTARSAGDLAEFVRWVEIQASDMARVSEPMPVEDDDDAVRLLTIHGAKGLEFPIVLLAGAPTLETSRNNNQLFFSSAGDHAVKIGAAKTTSGFDHRSSIEDVLEDKERIRLHYVAASRARDYLIVSAYHKAAQNGGRSMGKRTWEACQRLEGMWEPFKAKGGEVLDRVGPVQLSLVDVDFRREKQQWQAAEDLISRLSASSRQLSPTRLAAKANEVADLHLDQDSDHFSAERFGLGPVFGSAVHEVLELVALDANDDAVANLAASVAERHQIGDLADQVRTRVVDALGSDLLSQARQYLAHRELYVAAPVGSGSLEGYIDLCIERPNGLLLVDYKTDVLAGSDPAASAKDRGQRYVTQMAAYSLMLEKVVDLPVLGCHLLFLSEFGVFDVELELDESKLNTAALIEGELGS